MAAKNEAPRESFPEYDFNHANRGTAIIFCNWKFEKTSGVADLSQQMATIDVTKLKLALMTIGFKRDDIKEYENQKVKEMMTIIDNASKEDHSDSDCFLCIITSHGGYGKIEPGDSEKRVYHTDFIYGTDKAVSLKALMEPFVVSETLLGKPKIFIIDACRGFKQDKAVSIKTFTGPGDKKLGSDDKEKSAPTSPVSGITGESTGDVSVPKPNEGRGDVPNSEANEGSGDVSKTGAIQHSGDVSKTGASEVSGDVSKTGARGDSGDASSPGASEESSDASKPGANKDSGGVSKTGASEDSGDAPNPGASEDSGDASNLGASEDSGDAPNPGASEDSGDAPNPGASENSGDPSNPESVETRGDNCGEDEGSVTDATRGRPIPFFQHKKLVGFVNSRLPEYIPVWQDYLLVYATQPGFVAFGPSTGSPFVKAFHGQISKMGERAVDFLKLLTRVNHDVAFEYETGSKDQLKKQMPWIACRLTKDIRIRKIRGKKETTV